MQSPFGHINQNWAQHHFVACDWYVTDESRFGIPSLAGF